VDKHSLRLPQSYYLDESDPDSVILGRSDGSFAAAFSAQSATKEGIRQGATEDYHRLLAQALASQRRATQHRYARDALAEIVRAKEVVA
jgi:hypothetical protein